MLRNTASLLEQAYHSAQVTVAAELERLNDHYAERGAKIQQLTEQIQALTRERDDARAEVEMLKGRLPAVAQTVKRLIKEKDTLAEEAKKVKNINLVLAKMIKKTGGNVPVNIEDIDNETDGEDGGIIAIGPYQVPEALARTLSEVVTSSLSDQFERRMAQSSYSSNNEPSTY